MDDCFDMDLALTMEGEEYSCSSSSTGNIEATTAESLYMSKVTAVGACTICMDGFQSSNGIGKQVPCAHVYHHTCIVKWLSLHHSCPLCRSNFSGHRKINLSTRAGLEALEFLDLALPPTPVASV
ncbi:hypothetical protein LguiA_020037 [Lonicera macranthoides]